ncbi:uncharacterized protein LOC134826453 [Bolinopsis microptera]|uniref:uncharacterized protein LOC134826453 n=1 Tax=Bolinopsis microptera TaxID=2820187 RepID=UPI0030791076
MVNPDNQSKAIETAICQNCVTFVDEKPKVYVPPMGLSSEVDDPVHSTYSRDYPGHKRISPPLVRRPHDALPISTDYKNTYITTCQERFKPWDMKTIPRYENKAPRRHYTAPEITMHSTTSYKDDFAKIVPLPNIQRMSRNKKKPFYMPQNLEAMVTGTTYKKDFGSWKVSVREIPPWARRKPRTTPPPFLSVTTQKRDYSVPFVQRTDVAQPYRPKDGFTFTDSEQPMNMTTMYSAIHDKLQPTKDVYA